LRKSDFIMAAKMLKKSLQLYPLPGVEALAAHATAKLAEQNTTRTNQTSSHASPAANGETSHRRSDASASANGNSNGAAATPQQQQQQQQRMGEDGRSYTGEQHEIVHKVLRSKQGGRGAHYRVLGIAQSANETEIKRAYRKLSLKVHPDKNSAPGADDAFKSVSLAYATLSDVQKRNLYDRFGDEDPDENRTPGRGGPGGGVHMRHGGQEMSPEDIFNAFFNGQMGGGGFGGNGMHFTTTGFGPGFQFRAGGPQQQQRRGQRPQQEAQQQNPGFASLFQLLPVLFFVLLSLLSSSGSDGTSSMMPGEGKYFMLTVRLQCWFALFLCIGFSYDTLLPSFSLVCLTAEYATFYQPRSDQTQ
jgi:DnaJ homolog subfamily B member 12